MHAAPVRWMPPVASPCGLKLRTRSWPRTPLYGSSLRRTRYIRRILLSGPDTPVEPPAFRLGAAWPNAPDHLPRKPLRAATGRDSERRQVHTV